MTRLSPEQRAAAGVPVLFTPEEAAQILRKSAYWLKRNAGQGTIPHTRIGRTISFTAADLAEITRNGARKPGTATAAAPAAPARVTRDAAVAALQPRVPRRRRPGAA
jgi:hypothetical protein